MTELSVIIPCSAKGAAVLHTLARIPDDPEIEIILVLSNSDDNTRNLVRSVSRRQGLRLYEVSSGSTAMARNKGILEATGRTALLLDADILLPADLFYRRCDLHRRLDNVVVTTLIDGYDVGSGENYRDDLTSELDEDVAVFRSHFPWLHGTTAAVSFSLQKVGSQPQVSAFDEGFVGWGGEDQEWCLRLCQQGFRLLVDRRHRGMHQTHPRDMGVMVNSYRRNMRRFIATHNSQIVECLGVVGCRYAEEVLQRLTALCRRVGWSATLRGRTGHVLGVDGSNFGFLLPFKTKAFRVASANPEFVRELPLALRLEMQRELRRVASDVEFGSLEDAPECALWDACVRDFPLAGTKT